MLQSNSHHCNGNASSHFSEPDNIFICCIVMRPAEPLTVFCCHGWFWGTQWGVLLASSLCHNNKLSPRCLLRHMPTVLWVSFSFRVQSSTNSLFDVLVSYVVCFVLSGSHVTAMFTNGGSTIGVCDTAILQRIPLAGICASRWWSVAHASSVLSGCSSHCFD